MKAFPAGRFRGNPAGGHTWGFLFFEFHHSAPCELLEAEAESLPSDCGLPEGEAESPPLDCRLPEGYLRVGLELSPPPSSALIDLLIHSFIVTEGACYVLSSCPLPSHAEAVYACSQFTERRWFWEGGSRQKEQHVQSQETKGYWRPALGWCQKAISSCNDTWESKVGPRNHGECGF